MRGIIRKGVPEHNIRWNQALVSPSGKHYTELRPDIQYIGNDGRVHIVEIVNTNKPKVFRQEHIERLLGEHFGSYVVKYVTSP